MKEGTKEGRRILKKADQERKERRKEGKAGLVEGGRKVKAGRI